MEAIQASTDLVFLSPITPSASGIGLAMRAHRLVEALADRYRVHLRVIPIQDLVPASGSVDFDGACATQERVWREPGLLHRLRHIRLGEIGRLAPELHQALCESLDGIVPGSIVAFRHCLVEAGLELRKRAAPSAHLIVDLDEMESNTRERLAALHTQRGERRAASTLRAQAEHYRAREAHDLSRVDQVWVCSRAEAGRLRSANGVDAKVIPNVVELPSIPVATVKDVADPWVILLVGGLGYLPNRDAAEWMAGSILPRLRRVSTRPLRFRIVGEAQTSVMRRLARHPTVECEGYVGVLGPEYAAADLCLVPLRAGGGTRIKLLEALAHARPVVSTSLGAEGLDVSDGRELRIADDAEEFAEACRSLLESPDEAARLGARGRQLVGDRYVPQALRGAVQLALEGLA